MADDACLTCRDITRERFGFGRAPPGLTPGRIPPLRRLAAGRARTTGPAEEVQVLDFSTRPPPPRPPSPSLPPLFVAFMRRVATLTATPAEASSASDSPPPPPPHASATSRANRAASPRHRARSPPAPRAATRARTPPPARRFASSGSVAASRDRSASTSSRKSTSHAALADANALAAVSHASSAFASSAFLPVNADGISAESFFAVSRDGRCGGGGGWRGWRRPRRPRRRRATPPDLCFRRGRSVHTLTSLAQLLATLSSPVWRRVCFTAQDMIGHIASIHSLPFLREFCMTSLARYRKPSLRLPGAARSSRCQVGARILARLRWNTHQCESVSMLCDRSVGEGRARERRARRGAARGGGRSARQGEPRGPRRGRKGRRGPTRTHLGRRGQALQLGRERGRQLISRVRHGRRNCAEADARATI